MAEADPPESCGMTVLDAVADRRKMAGLVDFIFCAVDLDKASTRELEEDYARLECLVISNNSACRALPDVPMVIPEVNPGHLAVIPSKGGGCAPAGDLSQSSPTVPSKAMCPPCTLCGNLNQLGAGLYLPGGLRCG